MPWPTAAEAQVWVWPLAPGPGDAAMLSAEERARAARFVFARDRDRYVAAHAGMRRVLGGLLGIPPGAVALAVDARGKPRLGGSDGPRLFFNLSHSHDLAALGVASGFDLGVDIERVRPISAEVAEHFFSPRERAALAALAESERGTGFFNAWTRKEAYLKAIGLGLAVPLDSFDVSLAPGAPARLLHVRDALEEAGRWRLLHFTPAPGYVGAVAARARDWRLSLRHAGEPAWQTDQGL